MHAVILAAGMGTRLGGDVPKPLTDLGNGRTLLGNQVDVIGRLLGRDRIMIVVGYEAMSIIRAFPDLMYVYNRRFAETNTARSLLQALTRFDDDVLWTNADVYFEEPTIRRLCEQHPDSSRALVNSARVAEEEIKYTLHEDGSIAELSKSVAEPLGEALGVNVVCQAERGLLCDNLCMVADRDYFERALELATMDRRMRLMPVEVGDDFCREVDFPDDLDVVRRHVSGRASL